MKKLFLLGMLLCGCVDEQEYAARHKEATKNIDGNANVFHVDEYGGYKSLGRLKYFKDNETNLCFVFTWGGYSEGGPALTNVPCTEEVLKKINGGNR